MKLKFEPAVWKGIIAGVVGLLAIWGLDVADLGDRLGQSVDVIATLIPLVVAAGAGLWIRPSVTPNAKVAERVTADGEVVAGPANDVVTEGVVVRHQGAEVPLEGYEGKHFDV